MASEKLFEIGEFEIGGKCIISAGGWTPLL